MTASCEEALVAVSHSCSIGCRFCFRADVGKTQISKEAFSRTASRLRELGVVRICLTGGEPAHHKDIGSLIRIGRQFGLSVSIVTAAREQEDVARLDAAGRLLAHATVSADSSEAARLSGVSRSVESAITTVRSISCDSKSIHVICFDLSDSDLDDLERIATDRSIRLEISPLIIRRPKLDPAGRRHLRQTYERDLGALRRRFALDPAMSAIYDRVSRWVSGEQAPDGRCSTSQLYVNAAGSVRRCPYDRQREVSIWDPRPTLKQHVHELFEQPGACNPSCAAICRQIGRAGENGVADR